MSDLDRHFFWLLVGMVIGYYYVPMATVTTCMIYAREIIDGKFVCDKENRVLEMLPWAITAMIALWTGMRKGV